LDIKSGEKSSYNFFRVLRTIWQKSGTSRTELSQMHDLDKSTVSQIVSQFIDSGLVRVANLDSSNTRPGRRAELLEINDEWGCVAGIEIRPDGISSCATGMHGRVIATHHHRQPVERDNLQDSVMRCFESLHADDRVSGRPIACVGVGISGIVRREDAVILHSIALNIQEPLDFDAVIGRHLPVPVIIDNDANCCAWGETVYDRATPPENSLFVLLEFRDGPDRALYGGDIGLGLSFVFNGSVYYGEGGSAGEFRSVFWRPGCSNQFAIPDADAAGILAKPEPLERLITELAQHIALFVNTLNLKKVYVGGDAGPIRDLTIGTINRAIQNNWPYAEPVECAVELATYDTNMVAIGAAAMALEHIFEEPVLPKGLRNRNAIWAHIMRGRQRSIGLGA
jgi:predicted NBD/HSP70 family sugar kinase